MQRILVTGAAGFIGSALVPALAQLPGVRVCGVDIRPPQQQQAQFEQLDLRDTTGLTALFQSFQPTAVVHLASIVTPPPGMTRADMRDIDVGATETLVGLCVAHGVEHLTVTTSGAAYGYHADNPPWIDEDTPIRGNVEFAYSDHKRQIEELLARTAVAHPQLKVLILRPGTILGRQVANQITALFAKPRVLGVAGCDSPFVFIWDEDVVRILAQGVTSQATGAFNLAGDGAMTMREIAEQLGKPYLPIPAWLLRALLTVLHPLGLVQYGPEQVGFLQYRPVLDNARLKRDFAYTPHLTSAEAFAALLQAQPNLKRAP
jgi:UDP-glucose 4-epimerase